MKIVDLSTNGTLIVPDGSCADEIASKILQLYNSAGVKVRGIGRIDNGIIPPPLIEVNGTTMSEEVMLVWRDSRDREIHHIMARHYCANGKSSWRYSDGSIPVFVNGGVVWFDAEHYLAMRDIRMLRLVK